MVFVALVCAEVAANGFGTFFFLFYRGWVQNGRGGLPICVHCFTIFESRLFTQRISSVQRSPTTDSARATEHSC
jgi:hypothetical protein